MNFETTDYPVGKLKEFPLIDNEDILVKEDIFRILEESGVGIPAYYNPIEFEVDGKRENIAVVVLDAIFVSFSSVSNGFGFWNSTLSSTKIYGIRERWIYLDSRRNSC